MWPVLGAPWKIKTAPFLSVSSSTVLAAGSIISIFSDVSSKWYIVGFAMLSLSNPSAPTYSKKKNFWLNRFENYRKSRILIISICFTCTCISYLPNNSEYTSFGEYFNKRSFDSPLLKKNLICSICIDRMCQTSWQEQVTVTFCISFSWQLPLLVLKTRPQLILCNLLLT